MFMGPSRAEQTVEVRLGFSLRGCEKARDNLHTDVGRSQVTFTGRRDHTSATWRDHLGKVAIKAESDDQATVFGTALYHSMVKPCFAPDESPSWTTEGPYAFDICTMWDIYRTQLPLMTMLFPQRSVALAGAMLSIAEQEGNLPIGYRMAKGADRFSRQGSALAHTFLADLCQLDLPGIDWDWAMVHLEMDLRRTYGEDYLVHGVAHPISHTLDLAYAYHCTAAIAHKVRDRTLAQQMRNLAKGWQAAYDPDTGLLRDSTFYEGGRWNYSFRLLHDMRARIALAGGDAAFVGLLDRFFGYDAAPVTQPGVAPGVAEMNAGYGLCRFEGLNNEPDYEAPWSYHYAGRPDRTAEVVHAAVANQFGTGRGGLPGNDDSGGLSAWYVWATLGLFPVAGQNLFLVSAPAVAESTGRLPEGELSITTTGFEPVEAGGPVSYVQSVAVDGKTLERPWISGRELRHIRNLHIELGPQPSGWGTRIRPPSTSDPLHTAGGEA
jgi:predicted alpha-1,2-mannosidase